MKTYFYALVCVMQLFLSNFVQASGETLESYRLRQDNSTPKTVLDFLKRGNDRFAAGTAIHGGYAGDARKRRGFAAKSQRPLAVVLSCIDSRTSPEVIFDTTIGDLFTARVGANVINKDILGSLEISVASGVKVVVVLGHTDCGGVKGACRDIDFGHMTQLLARVKQSKKITDEMLDADPDLSHEVGERVVGNPKYIAKISHTNARRSAEQVYQQSGYLKEQVDLGNVILVPALYDVHSGKVKFDEPI